MANAATPIAQFTPYSFIGANSWPDLPQLIPLPGGYGRGLSLRNIDTDAYDFFLTIPTDATVGTGLTFRLFLCDDGDTLTPPVASFATIQIGLTVKKIVSGTDTSDMTTAAGTEQTSDIALSTTSKVMTVSDFAVANANLDSAGAGDNVMIRLRRIGSAATDTFRGRAVLAHLTVFNTATA